MSSATESHEPRFGHLVRIRLGQILGLLFLIGPFSDLARGSGSPAHLAAISATAAAFVALYLALLPPVAPLVRRGRTAIHLGLALLAATAGLTLVLGAPRSFAALFVYVVAAGGLLLPPRASIAAIAATAACVGVGLAIAGSSGSSIASFSLTIVAIGCMMAAFGHKTRANLELRAAREELAELAVSEERLRFARDVHDLLGHSLSVIALKSELAAKLVERDPERVRAELADVQLVTRQALREVREAVQGYRRLAFADAVAGARTALAAAGIECRVDGAAVALPAEVENVLAWALREATTNVVRHSDAHACAITLSADSRHVALEVEDDGTPAATEAGSGTGLTGVAERAERLRGSLEAGAAARRRLPTPAHRPAARIVIRVLIAEDQAMVRGALASLLSLEPDIEVVAEVDRGDAVLDQARASCADVALLDIEMPGLDGISAAAELARKLPATRTLILTTFGRPGYLRQALEAGAGGFLLKDAPAEQLAHAIREVAAGRRAIDPDLAAAAIADGASPLTEREQDVLSAATTHATAADDRRRAPPVRGHRAQLPERRHPQARRPQPQRSTRDRDRQGLAARLDDVAYQTRHDCRDRKSPWPLLLSQVTPVRRDRHVNAPWRQLSP